MKHNRFAIGMTAAAAALIAGSTLSLADVPPVDAAGWTVLSPATGALVYYVSSSSGADTNAGTQAAPFRTLAKGYQTLRDGHPDQLLLKCGDTWNEALGWAKASGDPSHPMVLASYGTGQRPKIRTTGTGIYGGEQNKSGVIIADLDLAPVAPASGSNGISFFAPWSHVTVEGCLISGYAVNIVMQEVDANRSSDMHIRRNVIVDSAEPGGAHSQGLFMGSCDNTVVEGNVFDLNANVAPYAKHDMFCHNVYLHQTCGPSIFRDNITSRACSHGVQQRSGGTMENNLAIACPIDLFQGDGDAVPNAFRNNVALDSNDINSIDVRGFGFWLNGVAGSTIENNVAAHQHSGTANVVAFNMSGVIGGVVRNNVVYDWNYAGHGWGEAFIWDAGASISVFENNQSYQPSGGECITDAGPGAFSGNRYWSVNPIAGYQKFTWQGGAGEFAAWKTWSHETGSTFANPGVINATIDAYLQSLGMSGSVPEFMAQARLQSKQNWRSPFTANAANDWVRSRFGLGGPTPCYANCDGSTGSPVLNANDFQCFLNKFITQDPSANCDGSTTAPVLNANDFACFMNKFTAGCP